jgi:hypothetical protein
MNEINDKIQKLRDYYKIYNARKNRAIQRMQTSHTDNDGWYFAIYGIDTIMDFTTELFKIRIVEEPPSYIDLASALFDKNEAIRASYYSMGIKYELSITFGGDPDTEVNFILSIAERLFNLIKIKTGLDFLVPMAATKSWSVIAGAPADSVKIIMLDDIPKSKRFSELSELKSEDILWIIDFYSNFLYLCRYPKFSIAVEAIFTSHQQRNERMAIINLWAGIESILDIHSELRFRIAAEIAAFLEPSGKTRIDLYNSIKKLYDFRSKAVHGATITASLISQHILLVRELLCRILLKCIEQKRIPTANEFEESIHSTIT